MRIRWKFLIVLLSISLIPMFVIRLGGQQAMRELGNDLEDLDAKQKNDQHLIKGCQSRVWLVPEFKGGKIYFEGESDAVIVKGLVALLLRVVSGRTPEEIMESDLHFVDDIGLKQHLSPTRSNGLVAMIKQIKLYAVAYNRISS